MRDLILTLIIFGSLPLILRAPYIGILVWSWLSYMNPHKLTWGFAYGFPFAQIVAITLMVGLLFNREPKKLPVNALTVLWWVFIGWMCVTTLFAFFLDDALTQLDKVLKIQLVTFFTLMIMTSKERIILLVWAILLSIGFFGIKGGVFTLATGGGYRVLGPPTSFIADNNTLAVALLMVVPLMRYLQIQSANPWVKRALIAAMVFTGIAAIGSQSRGAFLAILAMSAFLWLKGKNKLITGILLIVALSLGFMFMPDSWHQRMDTIQNYEEDRSAMGRINAWTYSVNLANHRLTGGGFNSWSAVTFALYAPDPTMVHAAHSIYFGVLGDHGWPGLIMFLGILLLAWRTAAWIIHHAKGYPELDWITDLARMIQVSMVAYCTGGAFLSLAYFDLPWQLIAILVLGKILVQQHIDVVATGGALNQKSTQSPASTTIAGTRQ